MSESFLCKGKVSQSKGQEASVSLFDDSVHSFLSNFNYFKCFPPVWERERAS